MFSDKFTQSAGAVWKNKPISCLYGEAVRMTKRLRKSIGFTDSRLLEKEVAGLRKAHKGYYIHMLKDSGNGVPALSPALGHFLSELPPEELDAPHIVSAVSRLLALRQISAMDAESILWQIKFCVIKNAVRHKDSKENESARDAAAKLFKLRDISYKDLDVINPLSRIFSEDTLYAGLTTETRANYRLMTAQVAVAAGLDEARLAREYMGRAKADRFANGHVGGIILRDYRRMFPFARLGSYLALMFSMAIILVIVTSWLSVYNNAAVPVLLLLPALAAVKPFPDMLISKITRTLHPLFSLELNGSVPENGRTLIVMSTLITSASDVTCGIERLKLARLKNGGDNIKLCLLCDLPPANAERIPADESLISDIKSLIEDRKPDDLILFIRERKYCKTQRCWQGDERKRGAILDLAELLRDCRFSSEQDGFSEKIDNITRRGAALAAEFAGDISLKTRAYENRQRRGRTHSGVSGGFRLIAGDMTATRGMIFILALDADTIPLMDSVSELAAIALHPCNMSRGIITPRVTITLDSYLRNGFSRAMGGSGGCAGASSYDCFSGEMYQDCFGEGIFSGKGLINIDILLDRCGGDRFKRERVLSHDILEGGACGVLYAGDVEFSDSFPGGSAAYFKRLHRWLRGDLQNAAYIFDKRFSPLTRWKLADNLRRALTPIFVFAGFITSAVSGNFFIGLLCLLAIIMPYITGFVPGIIRGRAFAFQRRFYSPVITQTAQLLRQCALEIIMTPRAAFCALDALVRVVWRVFVTKRRLLDWTTAAALDKGKAGFSHMILPEAAGIITLGFAVFSNNILMIILGIFFAAALPVIIWGDGGKPVSGTALNKGAKKDITENARKMWRFYLDNVTVENNFLPPDNVQYSPVFRVCKNTSPTNIGMYLLSAAAAYYFGFIDAAGFERHVANTIDTIERLQKWHGNLCNWYRVDTLAVISSFVSSVDSGNFVASMIALKAALTDAKCSSALTDRVESIITNTNVKPFFDKNRNMFSIGYDLNEGALSNHHYDLLMSEARLLSYYAVATKQADKSHWRSLGRVMGKSGRYAAPVSWTGTMFEYFMPELLLCSKEGSMGYEALRFCLSCQQKRARETGLPFGQSESGYYAFDEALNYQYKAHGVESVALKAGMDRERVVSPYASFLALSLDPVACYNNLAKLEKLGMSDSRYGFYEAADFTPNRVGVGFAAVKSHMAHHVGMSMIGAANFIFDGKFNDLFLSDTRMKRAEELLEEKIIAGEAVLQNPERQQDRDEARRLSAAEYTGVSAGNIHTALLSSGVLSVLVSDVGLIETYYEGQCAYYRSSDVLRRAAGGIMSFAEGERVYPLSRLPYQAVNENSEYRAVFNHDSAELCLAENKLVMGVKIYPHHKYPAEMRDFSVQNISGVKRQLSLMIYLEPVLLPERDAAAHRAFADLFLQVRYDSEQALAIISRKSRDSDEKRVVMAVGFRDGGGFACCFDRETVMTRGGGLLSVLDNLSQNRDVVTGSGGIPAPCLFLKLDISLSAHEQKDARLFAVFGHSEQEVLSQIRDLRGTEPEQDAVDSDRNTTAPLPPETIAGRMARRILPALLYAPEINKAAVMQNTLGQSGLWRLGISGDFPLILHESANEETLPHLALMQKGLSVSQIPCELVILARSPEEKARYRFLVTETGADIGTGTRLHVISQTEITPEESVLLRAYAAITLKNGLQTKPAVKGKSQALKTLPILSAKKPESDGKHCTNRFEAEKYIIEENPGGAVWSHVIANSRFGTLVSERSLGFTWAANSRENKLTPWDNNLLADNMVELLLIKSDDNLFDIINGARAEFSPALAEYFSEVNDLAFSTSVKVFEKGFGKEILLEIANTSDSVRSVSLAYYTEPTLGVDRKAARLIAPFLLNGNTIAFKTGANGVLSGAMILHADGKNSVGFMTNRAAFFAGEWNCAGINPAHDVIGAAVIKIELPPKETEKIRFILAFTKNVSNPETMITALKKSGEYQRGFACSNNVTDNIKDPDLLALRKYWLPWQSVAGRMWARTGFYQNSGAFGYRDQLQDCLAAVAAGKAVIARRQIFRNCNAQFPEGDVLHWWHDLMGEKKGVRTRYTDDLLWLPYVLAQYVDETGDAEILAVNVRYCAGDTLADTEREKYISVTDSYVRESVYLHAKRAMEKGYATGAHGLCLMGGGDWCDGYNEVGAGGKGESVWVSMFYAMTARKFAQLCAYENDGEYAEKLLSRSEKLIAAIDANAWDGEYYLRAFYDDGTPMGSDKNDQCRIDLLPQAFAALLPMPDKNRVDTALTSALDKLFDGQSIGGIIRLFSPPFRRGGTNQRPGYVMSYPEGVRENGGQYTHAAVWLAMGLATAGRHDEAVRVAKALRPFGRDAGYKNEPYYMSADIYTNAQCFGRGGWSLYTGSAGWYLRLIDSLLG